MDERHAPRRGPLDAPAAPGADGRGTHPARGEPTLQTSPTLDSLIRRAIERGERGDDPASLLGEVSDPRLRAELELYLSNVRQFRGRPAGPPAESPPAASPPGPASPRPGESATVTIGDVVAAGGLPPSFQEPGPVGGDGPTFPAPFGPYVLLEELGRGGMGAVYRARQIHPDREVALKVILAGKLASATQRERFRREAETAARLEHEGLVPVYDVGEVAGHVYYTMPIVPGRSLAERLAAEPVLPAREAAQIIRDAARAADHAHQRGIIHRDLKPGNLLLSEDADSTGSLSLPRTPADAGAAPPTVESGPDAAPGVPVDGARRESVRIAGSRAPGSHPAVVPRGGSSAGAATRRPRVRITDFGLARSIGELDLTHTGQILGTPGYMPPEQATGGTTELDATCDVFALGAILYRMLTGRPPFTGSDPVDVLLQTAHGEAPLPRNVRRDVPAELQWICMQCLEKSPAARYGSAAALAADLDRYLGGEPVEARLGSLGHRLIRWNRRRPLFASHVWGIATVMLVVVAIFGLLHVGTLPSVRYLVLIETILGAWLAACLAIQLVLERAGRLRDWLAAGWLAFDVLMLTVLLSNVEETPQQLLIGYAALVVVSGLFFRTDAIALTTGAAVVGHLALALIRPDVRDPVPHAIFFDVLLVIIGLTIAYIASRVRLLRGFA